MLELSLLAVIRVILMILALFVICIVSIFYCLLRPFHRNNVYHTAKFIGKIIDFDASNKETQTKIIRGKLTIHGITKEIDIKTKIEYTNDNYTLTGDFNVLVKDFKIKIPPILSSNIAKTISIKFNFQYQPYEE